MYSRIVCITCVAILWLYGSGCNKTSDPTYNDRPVVIGYLVAGQHPTVSISKQMSTSTGVEESSENVDSLLVYLSDGTDTVQLVHTDTVYSTEQMVVQEGGTYSLFFFYNGKEVTATTIVPAKPTDYATSATSIGLDKIDESTFSAGPPSFTMPDPIDITWTNNDNSYYMLLAEDTTTNPELVRDTVTTSDRPSFNFRNEPSISSTTRLQSMSFEYFGVYRVVLFHLQPEYATLYESTNNSSQNLVTPVTNVVNGFGIFTGMNADTLFITVTKN